MSQKNSWTHWVDQLRPTLCWDLGSALTRVAVNRRVVFQQPTCLLYHPSTEAVVEIGQAALKAWGKTPPGMRVEFPIDRGSVAQLQAGTALVKTVWQEISREQRLRLTVSTRTVVGVPASLTPADRRIFAQLFQRGGFGKPQLIPKIEAAYHSLRALQNCPAQVCVIDMGATTTEVGLFHEGRCLMAKTLFIGGHTYTDRIVELVRSKYQTEISRQTAEKLKHQPKHPPKSGPYKLAVRGKDILQGTPATQYIVWQEVEEHFHRLTLGVLKEIKQFLTQASPELVTSALESGIFLTGGGSLLPEISREVQTMFKVPTVVSTTPLADVIQGLKEA